MRLVRHVVSPPSVRSHLIGMSQWNFRDSQLISQINFEDFSEYFRVLCQNDDGFIDHFFREEKFEFYWRSNFFRSIPLRFPGIQITVKNLGDNRVMVSWKTPVPYLILVSVFLLVLLYITFKDDATELYWIPVAVLSTYLVLFIFYKIGVRGLHHVIDLATRSHKTNET